MTIPQVPGYHKSQGSKLGKIQSPFTINTDKIHNLNTGKLSLKNATFDQVEVDHSQERSEWISRVNLNNLFLPLDEAYS